MYRGTSKKPSKEPSKKQPKEPQKEDSRKQPKEPSTLMETLKEHLFTATPITDEKTMAALKRLGIVLVHKTPSGEGLRLVFVIPQGMGLVEGQQWLAQQIGLKAFDEACKDLARCSFAVPEEYVLFCNESELFKEQQPHPQQPHPQPLSKERGVICFKTTLHPPIPCQPKRPQSIGVRLHHPQSILRSLCQKSILSHLRI